MKSMNEITFLHCNKNILNSEKKTGLKVTFKYNTQCLFESFLYL